MHEKLRPAVFDLSVRRAQFVLNVTVLVIFATTKGYP